MAIKEEDKHPWHDKEYMDKEGNKLPWETKEYLAEKEELSPFWSMLIDSEDEHERMIRRVQNMLMGEKDAN